MRRVRVVNADSGIVLGDRVDVTEGWVERLRGLLGRRPIEGGEGLLLVGCRGIHTFGLRYPLDVAFLDDDLRIVSTRRVLPPWRSTAWCSEASHALELPAGALERTGTRRGERLEVVETGAAGEERAGDAVMDGSRR